MHTIQSAILFLLWLSPPAAHSGVLLPVSGFSGPATKTTNASMVADIQSLFAIQRNPNGFYFAGLSTPAFELGSWFAGRITDRDSSANARLDDPRPLRSRTLRLIPDRQYFSQDDAPDSSDDDPDSSDDGNEQAHDLSAIELPSEAAGLACIRTAALETQSFAVTSASLQSIPSRAPPTA